MNNRLYLEYTAGVEASIAGLPLPEDASTPFERGYWAQKHEQNHTSSLQAVDFSRPNADNVKNKTKNGENR